MQHATLLDRFYNAASHRDADTLRPLFTDDFTFTSPIGSFDTPDAYVAHLISFSGHVDQRRTVTEGDRVVHTSVFHMTDAHGATLAQIPLCDIFTIRDGKICSQEVYCDTALFPSP